MIFRLLKKLKLFFRYIFILSDEAQEAEAIQVLNAIYDTCESEEMPAETIARNAYALAMLYYTIHDIERVSSLFY